MTIALVGNQNSGKTTLFNLLTGKANKIGNYPGVSVNIKTGNIIGTNHTLVDLPGIYSLNAYSSDEEITKNYILNEKIDLIINIVDSSEFERSLYLTTQLMDLNIRMILVLNMNDLLLKKGISIDEELLSSILGISVLKISAFKEEGIDSLLSEIEKTRYKIVKKIFNDSTEIKIDKIKNNLSKDILNKRYVSIKLLEEDSEYKKYINNEILYLVKISNISYEDIINQRYKYIENIKSKVFKKVNIKKSFSEKIDKIVLNKYLAFPIFILIMFIIYYFSTKVITENISFFINKSLNNISFIIENFLKENEVKKWIINIIVNGFLSGIFIVISFLPQLICLFTFLSILESTGYISRVSFIFDSIFRKINLSGKSVISFLIGCGCSLSGILSTRTIQNDNQRKMTCILVPFIPCSAKIPIILMLCNYFFKGKEVFIIMSLYFLSITSLIISSLIMKNYVFNESEISYIEALPDYKMVSFKYIFNDVIDKVISFIKRAGFIILVSSIVICILSSYTINFEYTTDITKSILCIIGKKISWLFYPFTGKSSWAIAVSIIQGLFAKEQVVSSLNILNNMSGGNLIETIFTPASAYSFIVFNLFTIPCVSSLSGLKSELGNIKSVFMVMLYQLTFSLVVSTFVYQMLTNFNILILILFILILFLLFKFSIVKTNINKCNGCIYKDKCNK